MWLLEDEYDREGMRDVRGKGNKLRKENNVNSGSFIQTTHIIIITTTTTIKPP